MSLNESIVEEAALEWFLLSPVRQAQGYGGQVGAQSRFARTLAPALSQKEREEDREAIRRLNPAIPSLTLATLRDPAVAGLPKLLSGELSVAKRAVAGV